MKRNQLSVAAILLIMMLSLFSFQAMAGEAAGGPNVEKAVDEKADEAINY